MDEIFYKYFTRQRDFLREIKCFCKKITKPLLSIKNGRGGGMQKHFYGGAWRLRRKVELMWSDGTQY